MKMKASPLMICLILCLFSFNALASKKLVQKEAQKTKLLGLWWNQEKTSKIEIRKSEGKFYGKIVWLKDPKNAEGKNKLDTKNPDNNLRSQEIHGLEILKDFELKDNGLFEGGKIYNPKDGKTYSCALTILDNGAKLKVRGYIGVPWIGKTQIWERVK